MQMSSSILLIKYHNADKLTFNDQIQRMWIVLDNASIHKTVAVKEFAESTKLHILTIPCSFLYPPSAPPVGERGGTGSKNFPVLPSPLQNKNFMYSHTWKKNSKTHMFLYKFDVSLSI